jgi:hypothetical protein
MSQTTTVFPAKDEVGWVVMKSSQNSKFNPVTPPPQTFFFLEAYALYMRISCIKDTKGIFTHFRITNL